MNFELILSFLKKIKENNNREWMEANKKVYHEARDEFIIITKHLIEGISQFDEGLQGLDAKKSIFRLNRDIRFSKNKDPYKTNFGAFMMEGGKKTGNAGYYLHLQPENESFIAGGVYMPESGKLAKIRQEVDYNGSELKKITEQKDFKNLFGEIQGDKLKRAPKGYPLDHPNLELLKLKSFLVLHKVDDNTVLKKDFVNYIINVFKAMSPFNEYLNVAISDVE
ncbi:MAG: DUF2461 domain-containing protein [Cyclobacteriaceae bacterium]|nr:DUF2461 domain-containing protein [Cyclobacteriaceae bacterium]